METPTKQTRDEVDDQARRTQALTINQAWKDYDERNEQARFARDTMISMSLKIHDDAVTSARKMRDRVLAQAKGTCNDEDD